MTKVQQKIQGVSEVGKGQRYFAEFGDIYPVAINMERAAVKLWSCCLKASYQTLPLNKNKKPSRSDQH
jgi:hypothetical protein